MHLGKETGTWILNQNKEKKNTLAAFQNILKVALFELKKRMRHLFLKKEK